MTETSRNNAPKTRGRPFQKGNPGRPRGARHRATLAAESLLDGEAEALTRKAIERALEGDATALRLCLDRIIPPRKERPLQIALPALTSASDAAAAMAAITEGVARGEVTTGEAADLSALVAGFAKAMETSDLERRIAALEEKAAQNGK
jgi:hypothetical protein